MYIYWTYTHTYLRRRPCWCWSVRRLSYGRLHRSVGLTSSSGSRDSIAVDRHPSSGVSPSLVGSETRPGRPSCRGPSRRSAAPWRVALASGFRCRPASALPTAWPLLLCEDVCWRCLCRILLERKKSPQCYYTLSPISVSMFLASTAKEYPTMMWKL